MASGKGGIDVIQVLSGKLANRIICIPQVFAGNALQRLHFQGSVTSLENEQQSSQTGQYACLFHIFRSMEYYNLMVKPTLNTVCKGYALPCTRSKEHTAELQS